MTDTTTDTNRLDLAALRAIAEAATPGPWHWQPPSKQPDPAHDQSLMFGDSLDCMVLCGWAYDDGFGTDASDEDRAHIAAFDPSTALALLDRITELQGRLDIVEALAAGAIGRPWARVADQIIATCHGAVAARGEQR